MVFPAEGAADDALRGHDHEAAGVGMTSDLTFSTTSILYCLKAAVLIPLRAKKTHAVKRRGGRSSIVVYRAENTIL